MMFLSNSKQSVFFRTPCILYYCNIVQKPLFRDTYSFVSK